MGFMARLWSLLAIGLLGTGPLHAQVYGARAIPQFWKDGSLVRDQGSELVIEGPRPGDQKTIKKNPIYGKPYDVFEGRFWTSQRPEDGKVISRLTLYSSGDGQTWHPEGFLRYWADERPLGIWPLQKDRFLAVYAWHLERGEKKSPFAILKRGHEDEFEILDLPAPGFPGRLRYKDKEGWAFAPENVQLAFGWNEAKNLSFVRTPTALVLYNPMAGYFWSVDTTKEVPELRFGALYPAMKGPWLGDKSDFIQPPLLTVQPRPDGHVLIASRSEAAMFKAREIEATHQFPGVADPRAPSLPAHRDQEKENVAAYSLQKYPELLWWDLDPARMSFKREDPPDGAPPHFTSVAQLRRFTFRVESNGRVIVTK